MRTEHSHNSGFRPYFRPPLAALLFLGLTPSTHGQSNSPAGKWDCVISGARNGLASLTFSSDTNGGMFDGLEILVPKAVSSPRASLIPGMVEGLGSNGLGQRQAENQSDTNLFGGFLVEGKWASDGNGRVNASFKEIVPARANTVCTTNDTVTSESATITVTITNGDVTITYMTNVTIFHTNSVTNCFTTFTGGLTNTVSLAGKVVQGKRLTLVGKSPLGSFLVRGVPAAATPLADLNGSWLGTKKQNRIPSFEQFEMTNSPPFLTNATNIYSVEGSGPDYSYTDGVAILSSRKKIAFAFNVTTGTDQGAIRAVIGPFNSRKLKATTTGIESPGGPSATTNRIIFQVQKRATVP